MKTLVTKYRQWIIRSFLTIISGFVSILSFSQGPTGGEPPDPGAMSVYTVQNLSFGAFSHGNSGGTIIISNGGSRSATGDVIPLNMGVQYFNAIFEIDTPEGSIISILNGTDATLTGSNGGSLSLHIGNSYPVSPFVTTVPQPERTQVKIGGTLTIGNPAANPPGTYTGTFYITFNQE